MVDDRIWSGRAVEVRSETGADLTLTLSFEDQETAEKTYPGSIRVLRTDDGRLNVVNHVDIERYVACVVAGEVWPSFHDETFRVQAVVSRTFVLYQMTQNENTGFDVTSTQGSQVYRGVRVDRTGQRAAEAAEYTRGIVCTWKDRGTDRLFCTYYASACGGSTQSAAIFGPAGDVPPLAGGVRCDDCRIAPQDAYRWGPLRIPLDEVYARLTARSPEWESLGGLVGVEGLKAAPDGRWITLRLIGSGGGAYEISAERFRLALGGSLMRSAACQVRVSGSELVLENGRGFGHGLGLCQWGAEGQAREGRRATEILRYYYPGSKLLRAY
jgi:stage II sporulation protein D